MSTTCGRAVEAVAQSHPFRPTLQTLALESDQAMRKRAGASCKLRIRPQILQPGPRAALPGVLKGSTKKATHLEERGDDALGLVVVHEPIEAFVRDIDASLFILILQKEGGRDNQRWCAAGGHTTERRGGERAHSVRVDRAEGEVLGCTWNTTHNARQERWWGGGRDAARAERCHGSEINRLTSVYSSIELISLN